MKHLEENEVERVKQHNRMLEYQLEMKRQENERLREKRKLIAHIILCISISAVCVLIFELLSK